MVKSDVKNNYFLFTKVKPEFAKNSLCHSVKLGYNELAYNEQQAMKNKVTSNNIWFESF